jgi:hypothetical protein
MNNIVTRGLGTKSTLVTRGFGGLIELIDKAVIRVKGSAKELVQDAKKTFVSIRVALVEVNQHKIIGIKGAASGTLEKLNFTITAKVLFSRVYKGLKEIFIRATNARSRRHRSK